MDLLLLPQSPPTFPRYRQCFNSGLESIRVGSLTVLATGSLRLSPPHTHTYTHTYTPTHTLTAVITHTHHHMLACTGKHMEYYWFLLLWICSQHLGEWVRVLYICVCYCLCLHMCVFASCINLTSFFSTHRFVAYWWHSNCYFWVAPAATGNFETVLKSFTLFLFNLPVLEYL